LAIKSFVAFVADWPVAKVYWRIPWVSSAVNPATFSNLDINATSSLRAPVSCSNFIEVPKFLFK
jgi:hypothetical protein